MEDLRPSKLLALTSRAWGLRQMTSQAMAPFPDPDLPTMRSRRAYLPPIVPPVCYLYPGEGGEVADVFGKQRAVVRPSGRRNH